MDLYQMVGKYAFTVFPNPDKSMGEWIQILDRENKPLEKVVALPVKDPYHIIRDFMLIIELLGNRP
jgi:N-acylglucosamine 2-epimerase